MDDEFGLMLRNHNDVYTFGYDQSSSTCRGINHVTHPVRSYKEGIEFFGCCNGLVLLTHANKYGSNVLILWNPTTNECKQLPFPTFSETEQCLEYTEYGIGYNSRKKDFRVVTIGNFEGTYEVMVYSLKKNKWEGVGDIHIDNLEHRKIPDMARMPVNGALHWIADMRCMDLPSGEQEVILSFDIESEEFDHLPLPDLLDGDFETSLCVLGGSLCLLDFDPEVGADVWEMKQDGAEKSWTKLFTVDLQKHFRGLVKDLMPLQSLKDGNVLLGLDMDSGFHMVSYNLKHDTTKIINVQEFQKAGSFHTSVFGESQVSLKTGTYLGEVYFEYSLREYDNSDDDSDDDDDNDDSDDDHYCLTDSADDGDEGEGIQHNQKKSKKIMLSKSISSQNLHPFLHTYKLLSRY